MVGKGKKVDKPEEKEKGDGVSSDMETEEEDNDGLFSTPERGTTPAHPDNNSEILVPSTSVFSAPENLPGPPIFVLPTKLQEAPQRSIPGSKTILKRPAPSGESPIRKIARALLGRSEMESQISDILKVIKELAHTVEKRTTEILELKRLVEEKNSAKVAPQPTSKSLTMASHLATITLAGPLPNSTPALSSQRPGPMKPVQLNSGSNIIVDLSACDVPVKERTFSELRKYLQSSLQGFEGTQKVVLKGMNKDGKKEHRFFLFFHSEKDEEKARIHAGNWLSIGFPRGYIQSSITHKVKVKNVRVDAIINTTTNRITDEACMALSKESGYSIARIGWLSGPGKTYGSMVIHFTQKKDADDVLARGLMELGGESACTTQQADKSGAQRCFKCQLFGHMARQCTNKTVCGNCATEGHTHKDCTNPSMKCANCQGKHRANDGRCPSFISFMGKSNDHTTLNLPASLTTSPAQDIW